ncbi:MAG: BON domain-containing protein [Acidobacteriaceae bacterium]|nr:BON domain-containing protein [Acidobacteriaceae bacterium]
MVRKIGLPYYMCAVLGLLLTACSQQDKEKAREDIHKLDTQSKAEARKLKQDFKTAMDGTSNPSADARTAGARAKLDQAGEVARQDSIKAGQKLDQAALIAKVKAKLASAVSLSAASSIRVDVNGNVVTLSGTAPSEDQKRDAERAASQVGGVGQVVNNIRVE